MYRLLASVQGLQERNKTKKHIDKKKASSRLQEKRTKIRNVALKFLVCMYQESCSFSGIVMHVLAFGRTDLWKATIYDIYKTCDQRVFRAQADWTLTHTSHKDTEQSTI
jgi:hypothetical protein